MTEPLRLQLDERAYVLEAGRPVTLRERALAYRMNFPECPDSVWIAGDVGQWLYGVWLMRVKFECGYGDVDAVELYPRDRDVVNVANMRHLWILPELSELGWRAR